jgi:uncharacterized protein
MRRNDMNMRTGLILAAALCLPVAAAAQEPPPRTLNVSATATIEREPERATILLAVESQAGTAREASQRNAALMERVIAAIRQTGVPAEAIRTVSYELRPEYSRPERDAEPRIVAYRAINMVQVRADPVARVGQVIDGALAAGANRVAGLNFELRNPEAARVDALREAMGRARREAEAVAAAAGQQLGEPMTINVGGYYEPRPPMPSPMAMRAEMAMADTPIEGGQLTIGATVSVVYRLITP